MIPTVVHSFSRTFAKKHGVTGAVLLKHIAYKVGERTNLRDGKYWHHNPAKEFQRKLPYLSSSTISATVKKLQAKELLEIGNYNKWKHDRTHWYHVTDEIRDEVETDLIKFDAEVAEKVGVTPAVIHFNLFNFIRRQVQKKVKQPRHTMSHQELASKHLPLFSEAAIKKALAKLVKEKLIVKLKKPRSTYCLPEEDLVILRQNK